MSAIPHDDPTGIGLSAFLVDDPADATVIAALVPGAVVATFDEALDGGMEADALADRDVIAIMPGGAGPSLLQRARDAIAQIKPLAHEARIVTWGAWQADTSFAPPQGIDSPGAMLAWIGCLPHLTASPTPGQNRKPPAGGPSPAPIAGPLEWNGEPRLVREDLPSVPSLTADMVPPALRGWLADIAERIGCPLDFPVIGALIALAILIGRKVGMRPKQRDDWTVVPNLWGAIVGRPSTFKSPALSEATKPLRRLEAEAQKRHGDAINAHMAEALAASAAEAAAKAALKAAAKDGKPPEVLKALAEAAQNAKPPAEPKERRYTTSDPTVESLGEILRDNPNGTGLIRDELPGWMRTLEKAGREGDRQFYLEAWNGAGGTFHVDRIGRGHINIPSPCVSILGGMQPGPLRDLIRETAKGGGGDDGLLQRFQLLVWPDTPTEWRNVDRWPDTAAKNRAYEVFQALDSMTAEDVGATLEDDGDVPFLRFGAEAQERFNAWYNALMLRVRAPDINPMIEAHLGKYPSLYASLALLFHLADVADGEPQGPVSDCATAMAERWCAYLEGHATRVYASITEPDMGAARALSEKIQAGALANPFTPRDVYRRCWSGLDTQDAVNRAVAALEGLGWVQTVEVRDTGGRPREDIHIHPSLPRLGENYSGRPPKPTDKADKSPPGPPSVGFVSASPGVPGKKSAPAGPPSVSFVRDHPGRSERDSTPDTPAPGGWRVRV